VKRKTPLPYTESVFSADIFRTVCEKQMKLYRAIDVWKRADEETAVRYRCFESLLSKRFCVQSANFYRLPPNEQQIADLSRQFVELFIEQEPSSRSGEHSTLEEAIAAHDRAFS
jgi:hypothetical protein